MAEKRLSKDVDFPDLVADGENPLGYRDENPNGVSTGGLGRDWPQQYNWGANIAGPRWGEGDAPVEPAGDLPPPATVFVRAHRRGR